MPSTLEGINVVALTHFAAGPIAAQYLGALGAGVVKIEAPGRGDYNRFANHVPNGGFGGLSPYFLGLNKNQRSIVLDLKTRKGLHVARQLVDRADVLIENFRPGVLDRLGLGYEETCKTNPRLVYCSISAYDPLGPGRDRPGQDILLQGLSGIASLSGTADGPPMAAGGYIVDSYTGMQGVIGVLAALHFRNLTGEGQWVRADMISSALHMLCSETSYILNVEGVYERSRSPGVAHVFQAAPYGSYKTLDGCIILSGRPFPDIIRGALQRLGTLQDVENYLTVDGVRLHRDDIADAFSRGIGKLTTAEALDTFEPTGVWAVPVRTVQEALEDPAITAANVVREVDGFAGPHRVVVEPIKMGKSPIEITCSAPGLGEHTRSILKELGYSPDGIEKMVEDGSVAESSAHNSGGKREAH